MPMNRDEALAVMIAVATALGLLTFVLASGDAPPRPASALDPACAEWTDGCAVCARTDGGLACSTPGIACTRGPQRCLKRNGA